MRYFERIKQEVFSQNVSTNPHRFGGKEFRFGTAESVTSTLAETSTFRFRVLAMRFSLTSR
jgi:K+-transporting ATPase A subunit